MKQGARLKSSPGLKKMPTGIEGFDEITAGGLPQGRTTLIMGGPGSGKTIFALQTLVNGALKWGEPGIFVAFEENSERIIQNAAAFGWDILKLTEARGNGSPLLFFLDARLSPDTMQAGTFDLASMLAIIQAKAKEMGAKRVVFDGIDVLLTLLDDPKAERREVYRLHEWLIKQNLTGIITSKMEPGDSAISPRYSFMQFMVDCLVVLHQRHEDRVSLRRISVAKYRGSGTSVNENPFAIGPSGIEVSSPGKVELEYTVSDERISTGIQRLDNMFGGGYYRGTSILISGAPGTGKTTLAGAFSEASCRRGEKTLYISFDEAAEEIVRNLSSVGIALGPFNDRGVLRIYSARTEAKSADEHLLRIEELILEHDPRCVIIDPLSAIAKAGGESSAINVAQRLIRQAKKRGITLLTTTLLDERDPLSESTPLHVSTVADTWIHLSYVAHGGERNRALTIVKSRGTKHSSQVRELILSHEGVTLSDVYAAGGLVLMGTARWQKEAEEAAERERIRFETERKRQEIETVEKEIQARMDALNREVEGRRAELAMLLREHESREKQWIERQREMVEIRGGEVDAAAGNRNRAPLSPGKRNSSKSGNRRKGGPR